MFFKISSHIGDKSDSNTSEGGGGVLNPTTTTKTKITLICQLINIKVTLPYVSPLKYTQWEKGVKRVFAFVPGDLMSVKAIILRTMTSEQLRDALCHNVTS